MSVAFDSEIAAAPSGSRSSPRRAPPADPDRRDHDRALRDRRRPTRYRIQAATPEPGWTMPARTQEQGSTGRRVSALLLARSRAVSPTTETDEGTVVLRALASAQMRAPDWRSAARLLRTSSDRPWRAGRPPPRCCIRRKAGAWTRTAACSAGGGLWFGRGHPRAFPTDAEEGARGITGAIGRNSEACRELARRRWGLTTGRDAVG
jgi:hypothetical protein